MVLVTDSVDVKKAREGKTKERQEARAVFLTGSLAHVVKVSWQNIADL